MRVTVLLLLILSSSPSITVGIEVVDDFSIDDELISPDDFPIPRTLNISVESPNVGQFRAVRSLYMSNNTLQSPVGSIDVGKTADSRLTFGLEESSVVDNAGWLRMGVSYSFPEPLTAFSDRSEYDAIVFSMDVDVLGDAILPHLIVTIDRRYRKAILSSELVELSMQSDGDFVVAMDLDGFFDRGGRSPGSNYFNSINNISVSFLQQFIEDRDGSWQVSISEFGPGLQASIPEPTTLSLVLVAFCLAMKRRRPYSRPFAFFAGSD